MPGTATTASHLGQLFADGGVSSNVIRILEDQRLASVNEVNDLSEADWARLFELGVKVGDKARVLAVTRAAQEPKSFHVAPASVLFNILAYAVGALWAVPGAVIGYMNVRGPFLPERELNDAEQWVAVIIPGILYEVVLVALIEAFRTYFSTDVLQQRSVGVSLREAQRSNLTNMAIVAALLLTVIIAMVQADAPMEEAGTNNLLSQWYMLFLVASMVPLFSAIIMASLLLLYIEPLDDSAAISFIGPFMDYFGEPIISVIIGVFNFVPALTLWIFGAYGYPAGVLASLATLLLLRKVVLTQLYLAKWENPELDAKLREERRKEVIMPIPSCIRPEKKEEGA